VRAERYITKPRGGKDEEDEAGVKKKAVVNRTSPSLSPTTGLGGKNLAERKNSNGLGDSNGHSSLSFFGTFVIF
jgi:hypothetical protein